MKNRKRIKVEMGLDVLPVIGKQNPFIESYLRKAVDIWRREREVCFEYDEEDSDIMGMVSNEKTYILLVSKLEELKPEWRVVRILFKVIEAPVEEE